MKKHIIFLLLALLLFGCGGGSGGSGAVALVSVTIDQGNRTVFSPAALQLSATGSFADGTTRDVTQSVTSWVSSAPAVAAVDQTGRVTVTAGTSGTVEITAWYGTVTSARITLTVTPAVPTLTGITIDPPMATIPAGTSQQFTVTATYSDGTNANVTGSASWSSTSGSLDVSSSGKGTAQSVGGDTITVSFQGMTASCTVTVTPATLVSLSLDPPLQSVALGTGCRFTATGIFSDGSSRDLTSEVAWATSDPAIAIVDSGTAGLMTTRAAGAVRVTAELNGIQGGADLNVTAAQLVSISITPGHPTLPVGGRVTLSAIGTFSDGSAQEMNGVTWASSNDVVAGIAGSQAVAGDVGTATISATVGAVQGFTTLTVTPAYLVRVEVAPAEVGLPLGTARAFTATGTYSDGSIHDVTSAATWASSAPGIAGVSNAAGAIGNVTAIGVGVATITATVPVTLPAPGAVTGSTTVTVTPATLVSLAITPTTFTLPLGTTKTLVATGTYSDGSTADLSHSATWSSTAPAIAQVSNASGTAGKVTPLSTGPATITAAVGGQAATAAVTVTPLDLMNLQGTWVGNYTIYDDPRNPAEIGTYTFTLVLAQNGSTITASSILRGTTTGSGALFGTVSGDQFSFAFTYTSPLNGFPMTDTGTARVVGDTMTGDVVENFVLGYNCSYHLTLTRQP